MTRRPSFAKASDFALRASAFTLRASTFAEATEDRTTDKRAGEPGGGIGTGAWENWRMGE